MISDSTIAELSSEIYLAPAAASVDWDHYDDGGGPGGVCWAIKHFDDMSALIFRGSANIPDWILNVLAWVDPHDSNNGLGPLHLGFFLGLPKVIETAIPLLRSRVVVGGHSLGGARALQAAGLMVLDGHRTLASAIVFGAPKPGFAKLGEVLAPYPVRERINGDEDRHAIDYVPAMPLTFPPEEYEHTRAPVDVYSTPAPNDPWGIFQFHRMAYYEDGMAFCTDATE